MLQTRNARERLRLLGQLDLSKHIEVTSGEELWTIQKKIARTISGHRARLAVPSCNASGKTWLAARIALAFYDAFTPGSPCHICGGPCGGAKVITMSSKEEHLKDNLWGEIRNTYPKMQARGLEPVGRLLPSDLYMEGTQGKHFIRGQTATSAEGLQGYHAAHKLIIGDEATSVSEEVSQGITSLLASGDTRLLLIFNPTDTTTYAYKMANSPGFEVIHISAFDTPNFTDEVAPEGSNLTTPAFLEDLEQQGMGPGTYEWTTRVLGEFWDLSDDNLVSGDWYDKASETGPAYGVRQLGVDIAPYGTSENIISVRDGNALVHLEAHKAMRPDLFFQGPVADAVVRWGPHYLVYDADGVGAGAIGEAERVGRLMPPGGQVIGFRGARKASNAYLNTRAAWYWQLRLKLQAGLMRIEVRDPKLREQITNIQYSIQNGAIKVETKADMKRRGVQSPDRADGLMYAFAMSDDLLDPAQVMAQQNDETFTAWSDEQAGRHRHERAMWEKDIERMAGRNRAEVDPVLGVPY